MRFLPCTLNDLREAIRKSIFQEREYASQQKAKDQLVDKLVEAHDFPVPEAYIERQIEAQLETQFRSLAERGVDPSKLKIDWTKLKEAQRPKALQAVKASMLVDKIADRESIHARRPGWPRAAAGRPRPARNPRARAARRARAQQRPGAAGRHRGPGRPMNSHTRSAFAVVMARPTLPATVVMPTRSMPGWPCANAIASASSIPGSQSRMIRVAMSAFSLSCGAPDDGTERPWGAPS